MLLIDVHGWGEALLVACASTVAALVFAAGTMAWFRIKCRWWEVVLLLVATFVLFRPDWFADQIAPEYADAPASKFYEVAAKLEPGDRLVFLIKGQSLEAEETKKTVGLQLGAKTSNTGNAVADARKRLADAGVTVSGFGEMLQVSAVRFVQHGRQGAHRAGLRDRRRQDTDRSHQCALVLHPGIADGRIRVASAGPPHATHGARGRGVSPRIGGEG